MYPKIWLINLLLAALVSFLGVETYKVWSRGEPTRAAVTDAETPKAEPGKNTIKRVAPPESAYEIVAEKNLFSPQRSEPESAPPVAGTPVPVPQQKVPGEKVFLSGVVIADGYKAALIGNAVKKTNEKPERWVREGDSFGGFEVAEIQRDGVILSEGSQKFEIHLYDNSKPRSRLPVKKAENPTVIMTGGDEKAPRPTTPGRQTPPAAAARLKTPPPAAASNNPLQRLIRKKKPTTADTTAATAPSGASSAEKKTALNNLLEVFGNITKRTQ